MQSEGLKGIVALEITGEDKEDFLVTVALSDPDAANTLLGFYESRQILDVTACIGAVTITGKASVVLVNCINEGNSIDMYRVRISGGGHNFEVCKK